MKREKQMLGLTNYALRMPVEYQDAAEALKQLGRAPYDIWTATDMLFGRDTTDIEGHGLPSSRNAAILYFMRLGIPFTIDLIECSVKIRERLLPPYQEILEFLTANPDRDKAICEDFPKGSPAHVLLATLTEDERENGAAIRVGRAEALAHVQEHRHMLPIEEQTLRALRKAEAVKLDAIPHIAPKERKTARMLRLVE